MVVRDLWAGDPPDEDGSVSVVTQSALLDEIPWDLEGEGGGPVLSPSIIPDLVPGDPEGDGGGSVVSPSAILGLTLEILKGMEGFSGLVIGYSWPRVWGS